MDYTENDLENGSITNMDFSGEEYISEKPFINNKDAMSETRNCDIKNIASFEHDTAINFSENNTKPFNELTNFPSFKTGSISKCVYGVSRKRLNEVEDPDYHYKTSKRINEDKIKESYTLETIPEKVIDPNISKLAQSRLESSICKVQKDAVENETYFNGSVSTNSFTNIDHKLKDNKITETVYSDTDISHFSRKSSSNNDLYGNRKSIKETEVNKVSKFSLTHNKRPNCLKNNEKSHQNCSSLNESVKSEEPSSIVSNGYIIKENTNSKVCNFKTLPSYNDSKMNIFVSEERSENYSNIVGKKFYTNNGGANYYSNKNKNSVHYPIKIWEICYKCGFGFKREEDGSCPNCLRKYIPFSCFGCDYKYDKARSICPNCRQKNKRIISSTPCPTCRSLSPINEDGSYKKFCHVCGAFLRSCDSSNSDSFTED